MTARRLRTLLRGRTTNERFVVRCVRFDGRERDWQRYADRAEAEKIAAHLSSIGCAARVVDIAFEETPAR
jgi:hypothetical protein